MNTSAEGSDISALSELVLRLKAAAEDDLSTILLLTCAAVQLDRADLATALAGGFSTRKVQASNPSMLAACSGLTQAEVQDRLRGLAGRGLIARQEDKIEPTASGLAYLDGISRKMGRF